jgi:hypothetical protein
VPVPTGATTGNVVATVGGVASNGSSFTVQADTTPPTVPTGLTATAVSSSQINLSWTASTDNVGVTGYDVYRGGTQVGTSPTASYSDTGLAASTSYTYTVAAYDAAGNTSAQSTSASATTLSASASCASGLPCALGWYEIPGTTLSSVVPSYSDIQGATGPSSIETAWSSALVDNTRNRFVIMGEGHTDGFGNGIVAIDFDANPIAPVLVHDASHGSTFDSELSNGWSQPQLGGGSANNVGCPEAVTDVSGTGVAPNARHTYNGLIYLPNSDLYWYTGAGLSGNGGTGNQCGSFSDGLWVYSPSASAWTQWNLTSPHPATALHGDIALDAYNPNDGCVYFYANNTPGWWKNCYDSTGNNQWTALTLPSNIPGNGLCPSDQMTSAFDASRNLYVCVGSGHINTVNVTTNTATDDSSGSGCATAAAGGGTAPGVAYDPLQQLIVIWAGGNSVYTYNGTTHSCSTVTYSGGPGSIATTDGVYGRFQYMPALGGFVLANGISSDIYFLRLTTPATAALADFQNRCATTGVIVCEGFDSASEFVPATSPNSGLYSNSGPSNIEIVQDTSIYASGGGSLKFPMTANGAPVQDNNWLQTFCSAHPPGSCTPTVFQQNSDFYIQFRYMVDSGYLQDWEACCGSSPKIFDVAHHTSSCGQTELTVNNRNGTGMPMAYGDCGGYGMYVDTSSGLFSQNTPYNFQSGYYNCEYPNTPLSPGGCFTMPANTWITFYEHVHIGTYSQSNSVFELWVAPATQPMQYLIKINDFVVPPPDGGVITGYDAIWFNVYMTDFSGNNQAANVWLDEVIVSTNPIPSPAANGGDTPQ